MASDGERGAFEQSLNADEVLGDSHEEDEGDLEDDFEGQTDDEDSETESETETESESGTDSESETETESESETESDTETEAENTETERSTTGAGDRESPRPQQTLPAGADAQSLSPISDELATESLAAMQGEVDAQPLGMQTQEGFPAAPVPCSLPPATSRSASREGTSPQPTPRAEDARHSAAETSQDGQSEPGTPGTCSLPPAVSRNNSRECSRKSSHLEASTSGSVLRRSSGSLPPINLRSGSHQPSRKGSLSGSQAAPKRSQASSPKQVSPSRNHNAAPRYFQPPPPPPPPPKPKPRERHDTSAVDPLFLQTAVYRTVPNVGRVYDWKLQHEVNAALSKQRKQQVQMEKVLEAARVQLQVREANERAFQQWVAAKDQEKQQQYHQNRRIAYVTSVYQNLVKDDPVERKAREALWVSNFAFNTSETSPPLLMTRERISEDSERFRL